MASLVVTYDDGRTEKLRPKGSGLVAAEEQFTDASATPTKYMLYACWWGTQERKDGVTFDDWTDSFFIENEDVETVPPLPASPQP